MMYLLLFGDWNPSGGAWVDCCAFDACWIWFDPVGVGNGVDGYFGGDEAGVRKSGAEVIFSRKLSS